MASLDGTLTITNSEYRPCVVDGEKAMFHRWDIMETIDNEFSKIGFTRTMCNPVSNLQDATIYRIVARYEGVADKNFRIYTK